MYLVDGEVTESLRDLLDSVYKKLKNKNEKLLNKVFNIYDLKNAANEILKSDNSAIKKNLVEKNIESLVDIENFLLNSFNNKGNYIPEWVKFDNEAYIKRLNFNRLENNLKKIKNEIYIEVKKLSEISEDELKVIIERFVDRWNNSEELKWKDLLPKGKTKYKGFDIKISFGMGSRIQAPKFSWITFLKYDQTTSKGIYPTVNYRNDKSTISTIIGISRDNQPNISAAVLNKINSFEPTFSNDIDNIVNELNENIKIYEELMIDYNKEKVDLDEAKDLYQEKQPLNQILYGPPGTGKTYRTINKALEIIFDTKEKKEKEFDFKIKDNKGNEKNPSEKTYMKILNLTDKYEKRQHLKGLFEYFTDKQNRQIEFVTFHQSYGYEEFVEGIKAKTFTDDITKQKTITYDIESGTFKSLCEQAKMIKSKKTSIYNFDDKVNIWKISLGDSNNSEDEYLFDYCIENNKILLGFGDGIDFKECSNREEIARKLNNNEKYSYPPTAVNTLKNKMKRGDIVLVSYGNRKLRAIAKITTEYQYLEDDNLKTYVQARGVEWLLVPDEPFSYEKVLKKQFTQRTIYDIKNNVKIEVLKKLLTQNTESIEEDNKNYILIIDEINRGNISKIFGELITLIEASKRIGAEEEIRVKLPNSEEPFGVPQNLYIIGTMNTADRSIALMDTALRRRFEFTEMMPNSKLLENLGVSGINIKSLLDTINKRIEYLYDRDHTIGHAYFMSLKDEKIIDKKAELDNIFRNKIIPLLQEYFYDDWEKILMVLGKDGFIDKKEIKSDIFTYKNDEYLEDQQSVYTIKKEFDFSEFK